MAKVDGGDYIGWYSSVMNINEDFYKYVFKRAGVHIYSESNETFFGGSGFLVLHTNVPGTKKIVKKSGEEISFEVDSGK